MRPPFAPDERAALASLWRALAMGFCRSCSLAATKDFGELSRVALRSRELVPTGFNANF
jgi:hypothetical protein